ncbi:NAD-dependent epimerase/dehydratase family protein [Salipiger thiooxidans]|uniref:NAD-dependent epimerase/dehydratase family protein n=1 Tax=Salipiger thiooxidans TaxID=282683 RepID=UPI001CFA01F4|nr:NAD(P)-dependent oxidoreductase [Salipiger thiooxidans]
MSDRHDSQRVALVTGQSGFIGGALMRTLGQLGWQVSGLTDAAGGAVDLRDGLEVATCVARVAPQVIFHMGGISGPMQFADDATTVLRVNIEGTQSLLDAAAAGPTRRVILAGSVAGYATPGPSGPEPDSVYGLTKRMAELQAHLWARQTGREATALRIGSVYGAGRASENPMHQMVRQAHAEGRITVVPHRMEPCIDIDSCVALIAGLAEVPRLDWRYDVVADRPKAEEVAALIAGFTGAQIETVQGVPAPVPSFPEPFDPAPLLRDTGVAELLPLRDGVKALVEAFALAT